MKILNLLSLLGVAIWASPGLANAADKCTTNVLHVGGELPRDARTAGDMPSVMLEDGRTLGLRLPFRFTRVDMNEWLVEYGPTATEADRVALGTITFDKEGNQSSTVGGNFNPLPGSEHYGNTVGVDFRDLRQGAIARDIGIVASETIDSPCYEAPKRVGFMPFRPAEDEPTTR